MYINEGGDGSEKERARRDAFWGFGFVQCIRFSLECIIAQTADAAALPTIPASAAATTTAEAYRPPPPPPPPSR